MLTQIATHNESTGALADLVQGYAKPELLPSAEWLTRYDLNTPTLSLEPQGLAASTLKRAFDVIAAVSLLVIMAPVMVLVAVLVRLTSPGPVIYAQTRIGLNKRQRFTDRRSPECSNLSPPEGVPERRSYGFDRRARSNAGKPFILYKFRTMRQDAESDGARFAVEGDPRITRVGRILRLTRLDELPQLWNVIKGDMSFVGPRPERPEFIEELSRDIPGYLHRLRLKPGLTGLAQILNGYDNNMDSFRRKVAFDLLYLQNCSLWNDIKICLRTVGVVLTGKGAL